MVIVRVWRGVTPKSKSAKYMQYLKKTGLRDFSRTPGNLGATVWTRDVGDDTEFIIISRWKSMKSIEKFSGKDTSIARHYPKDDEFFTVFEPKVRHYRLALEAPRSTRG